MLVSTGGGISNVLGNASARISLRKSGNFDQVKFRVLATSSPMILGLTSQRTLGWDLNVSTNAVSTSDGDHLPVHQYKGQLFLTWNRKENTEDSSIHCLEKASKSKSNFSSEDVKKISRNILTAEELRKFHAHSEHPQWRIMWIFKGAINLAEFLLTLKTTSNNSCCFRGLFP